VLCVSASLFFQLRQAVLFVFVVVVVLVVVLVVLLLFL